MSAGFTYVELVVVIVITALLATITIPSLTAMRKGAEERQFRRALLDIAVRARSRAIDAGGIVALSVDKSTNDLVAVEESLGTGTQRPLQRLATPAAITNVKSTFDQNTSEGEDWTVVFYSDGKSTGGGIEFEAYGKHFSYVVSPTDGRPRVIDGPLPDLGQERWPAGSYVKS